MQNPQSTFAHIFQIRWTTISRKRTTESATTCSRLRRGGSEEGEAIYHDLYEAITPEEVFREQAAEIICQYIWNRTHSENINVLTTEAPEFEGSLFLNALENVQVTILKYLKEKGLGMRFYAKLYGFSMGESFNVGQKEIGKREKRGEIRRGKVVRILLVRGGSRALCSYLG